MNESTSPNVTKFNMFFACKCKSTYNNEQIPFVAIVYRRVHFSKKMQNGPRSISI